MIEVLKLALKALNAGEHAHLIMNTDGIKDKVRQAIKELQSQEPVAWLVTGITPLFNGEVMFYTFKPTHKNPEWWRIEPLYTHPPQHTEQEPAADDFFRMIADSNPKPFPPPQRTWVGLTDDDEILAISNTMPYADRFEFARAIEAKLKEKNT
jgi:hypothetical protein